MKPSLQNRAYVIKVGTVMSDQAVNDAYWWWTYQEYRPQCVMYIGLWW